MISGLQESSGTVLIPSSKTEICCAIESKSASSSWLAASTYEEETTTFIAANRMQVAT